VYKELKSIALRHHQELADSAVAQAYYEELLYNNMDALNMLYVATTRAKDYLYIATMAKKEDKLSNMGDVINRIFDSEFDENNLYEIVDDVVDKSDGEETNFIQLNVYPTSNRLTELYVPSENKHLKHLVNIEKSGRKGSLLHDILANASTKQEVEDYVSGLVLQGIIQAGEIENLTSAVLEVLNNADLKAILSKATQSITEKSIIDAKGKLHRPDCVLMTKDEVIVLDYKFTLEESEKHIVQVENYKNLLLDMGFNNVKSYLFYAATKKLKMV
jgi:ATP-dependent exoDNAse (exonuclease V) beta subunit